MELNKTKYPKWNKFQIFVFSKIGINFHKLLFDECFQFAKRMLDRLIDRSRWFSRGVICGLHARLPVGIVVDRRNGDQSGVNRLGCYRVNGSYLRSASFDLLSLTALPSRLARPRERLGNVAWARTRARGTGPQVEAGGNRTNLGKIGHLCGGRSVHLCHEFR